ncbi:MAG TPA: hypothetical protein VI362_00975 [Ignavibacteriaceae bacterium]|nr:hypothetical protein [Ignavibacteriaceae bacterium]
MKKLKLFIIVIVLTLSCNLSLCQLENDDKQIIQLSTGKDNITFNVLDYDTAEPLIGVKIYSFDLKKILATTDIDGIAITDKGLKGNLEISYVGYYPSCFKIVDNLIDSVIICLKPDMIPFGFMVESSVQLRKIDSLKQKATNDAQIDLEMSDIQLLTKITPTDEQQLFAKNHAFVFKMWKGSSDYKETYNDVVLNFLNKKYSKDIREELREICWRNHQL